MDKILDVFEVYADADSQKVQSFNDKLTSTMDVKIETNKINQESLWIDMMEMTIEHIDDVLRNPMRLIINEEEVVKIEKIKKITVDSIKHLSKNAGFIEDVEENGDVKPGKLLNVFKEETFNTYENRFIYTLIQKMLIIVRKQKKKFIEENKDVTKEFKTLDYKAKSYNGKNKIDVQVLLTASSEVNGMSDEKKAQFDRIRMLERNIINLTLTATYQALEAENVSLITPPLKKTNALLKNVHFQYAVNLWDFLINEMDKSKNSKSESKVREYKDKGKSKKYFDETFLLDYLILQNIENPELSHKHKKEIIEQLIANMVDRLIDVNDQLTEEQLRDLVSKQYTVIKYRKQLSGKEVQEIFKKHIAKYVKKIDELG